jgi:hypothetical protein
MAVAGGAVKRCRRRSKIECLKSKGDARGTPAKLGKLDFPNLNLR